MFNLGEISMKKSFIALAVLAAASVASAQSTVTLSGNYTFGYKSNKDINGTRAAGFGTDTAAVKFAATEDLGGGLKASAQVTAANLNRGGSVSGEDAKLDLMGSFGTITLGSMEVGNSILGRAQAGGPTLNFDGGKGNGGVLQGALSADVVKYTSPNYGGLSFNAGYFDHGAASVTGLGAGTTGGGARQPAVMFGVDYANGPIDAGIDVTAYQKKNSTIITPAVAAVPATLTTPAIPGTPQVRLYNSNESNRVRVSGSYDLGVAKLGAGFANYKPVSGEKTTELALGVSAPVGPVTLGAFFANSKTGTVKHTGFSFGAKYDLSKRTNVVAKVASWKDNVAGSTKGSRYDMLVGHSF
jgi:predicted porin